MSDTPPLSQNSDRPSPSLVNRLLGGTVLWVLPVLLLTALALTWVYANSTYRIFDDPLEAAITSLIASAQTGRPGQDPGTVVLETEPIDPRYQQALSGRYWVVGYMDDTGTIQPLQTSRSMSGETLVLPSSDAQTILEHPGLEVRSIANGPDTSSGEKLRIIARSLLLPRMNNVPVVFAAGADRRPAINAIRRFAGLATGILLLLSAGLIFGVLAQIRLGLRPLFDLRDKVVAVREGRAERVDGDYPSEIAPLANELNSLIGHNKDIVERARTHVSNLAHALKTPLAVLKNEAETSKSKLSEVVLRQSDTMRNQVDHHLRRARAAARGQAIGVSTDVAETVSAITRTLERIYRDKDIAFDIDIEPELGFRGEKRDFEEMVGNLLDNACKWSKSDIHLLARTDDSDPTMLTIKVSDNGPGLEISEYETALKRGMRLDEATPGTGFGLPIVEDLAKAYKGKLVLGKADIGGLKTTLTLPRRT